MVKLRSLLVLAAAISPLAAKADVPKILIVYQSVTDKLPDATGFLDDPYATTANYLAGYLDESGRVTSVLWGMTDANFRQAVLDGKLDVDVETISDKGVNKAADVLKVGYVLRIRTITKAGRTLAEAELLKTGRKVWSDRGEVQVTIGGSISTSDACRSLANTWQAKLFIGPLKDLNSAPVVETPKLDPGQVRPPVEGVTEEPAINNADLIATVKGFREEKKLGYAIAALRDAVDQAPFDPERRLLLIEVLIESGQFVAAAECASGGANLVPQETRFRDASISAWIAAGSPDKAQDLLNLALTKTPEDPKLRLLVADISLSQGKPEAAIPHLESAAVASDSGDIRLRLAQAFAMTGNSETAKTHLLAARKLNAAEAARYPVVFDQLDSATTAEMISLRDLIPRLIVSNQQASARAELKAIVSRNDARIALLEEWKTAPELAKVNEMALLAYKLFALAIDGLVSYSETRTEATLLDSRIDLAEALKLAREAREAFIAARQSN